MKKLLTALVVATTTIVTPVYGEQVNFNDSQYENLNYAFHFGDQFLKDGKFKSHNDYQKPGLGYIMAAIAWQESSGGENTGRGKDHNAYGMFQNYLPSVRAWTKQINWNMSDNQIKKMLKSKKNSATWAYVELTYWMDKYHGNIPKAIASYNAGNNYKQGLAYSRHVMEKAEYLKKNKIFVEDIEG